MVGLEVGDASRGLGMCGEGRVRGRGCERKVGLEIGEVRVGR